jgi:hypothetical protein
VAIEERRGPRRFSCNRPSGADVDEMVAFERFQGGSTNSTAENEDSYIQSKESDMKRAFVLAVLLSAAMVGFGAVGAAGANFAGTWVLDKSKSEGGQLARIDEMTYVVTQNDKTLTLDSTVKAGGQDRSQKATFNLDGSETMADVGGQMPGKASMKAKWLDGGKILEMVTVRNVEVQGNAVTITQTDHWELAEDGKVLKVHRKTESPRGPQESKLTFNKK